MTTTPDPTTGRPRIVGNPAPTLRADFEALSQFTAKYGTRAIGTTADRNAHDAAGYSRKGLRWYDTTLNAELVHNGTGWRVVEDDTGWVDMTIAAGWTAGSPAPKGRRLNGVTHLSGFASHGAGTAAYSTVFILPEGMRPAEELRVIAPVGAIVSSAVAVRILTSGVVQGWGASPPWFSGISFPS